MPSDARRGVPLQGVRGPADVGGVKGPVEAGLRGLQFPAAGGHGFPPKEREGPDPHGAEAIGAGPEEAERGLSTTLFTGGSGDRRPVPRRQAEVPRGRATSADSYRDLKPVDRVFECPARGWRAGRDYNASLNILRRAGWEPPAAPVELRPLPAAAGKVGP